MVPSFFISIDKIPLTSNGKIDKKALPGPDESMVTGKNYVPPTDEIEEKLVKLWQGVLHVERIGIDDNFFEIKFTQGHWHKSIAERTCSTSHQNHFICKHE